MWLLSFFSSLLSSSPLVVPPRCPPLPHFPFVPRAGKPKQTAPGTAIPGVLRHPRTEGREEKKILMVLTSSEWFLLFQRRRERVSSILSCN